MFTSGYGGALQFRDGIVALDKNHSFAERDAIAVGAVPNLPQHVHVEFTVQDDMLEFGVVVFDYQYKLQHNQVEVHLAVIRAG